MAKRKSRRKIRKEQRRAMDRYRIPGSDSEVNKTQQNVNFCQYESPAELPPLSKDGLEVALRVAPLERIEMIRRM